jgi:hypothetical protein
MPDPGMPKFELVSNLPENMKKTARKAMAALDSNTLGEIVAGLAEAKSKAGDGSAAEGKTEATVDTIKELLDIKATFLAELENIRVDETTAREIAETMGYLLRTLLGNHQTIRAEAATIHSKLLGLKQYFVNAGRTDFE